MLTQRGLTYDGGELGKMSGDSLGSPALFPQAKRAVGGSGAPGWRPPSPAAAVFNLTQSRRLTENERQPTFLMALDRENTTDPNVDDGSEVRFIMLLEWEYALLNLELTQSRSFAEKGGMQHATQSPSSMPALVNGKPLVESSIRWGQ